MTDTPALWRRSVELTDEIAALEALGTPKTPKDGPPYVAWSTYEQSILHQNRVKERDVVISLLRRAFRIIPTVDEMLA